MSITANCQELTVQSCSRALTFEKVYLAQDHVAVALALLVVARLVHAQVALTKILKSQCLVHLLQKFNMWSTVKMGLPRAWRWSFARPRTA